MNVFSHLLCMKEKVFVSFTILIGVLLALGIAEVGLQLFWDHPGFHGTHVHEPHPYYHHRPIPGIQAVIAEGEFQHTANHTLQGLRGDQVFTSKKPDSVAGRILFLGDSFTYGMGVEDQETFVQQVADRFPGSEVANTGAAAYDTRHQLAIMEKFGTAFQPDLTILCFFWNDLEGNLGNDTPAYGFDEEGTCIRLDAVDWQENPLALAAKGTVNPVSSGWRLKVAVDEGLKGLRYRFFGIRKRYIQTTQQKQQALDKTAALLDVMRCQAENIGTELVLLGIPDQSQIDPEDWVKNIDPLNYEVQDFLESYCTRHQLTFIDPRPEMIASFKERQIRQYYYYDRHLTAEGHRIIGEVLNDFMGRRIGKSQPEPQ